MRVLVVEDERKVADAIKEGLQAEHYDVVVERTGEDGYSRVTTETFDLVLLDLRLPGLGGLEVLTRLRKKQIDVPVLVITARDGIHQRVVGLDAGADDYLVKPFAFSELLARMRALTRRGRSDEAPRITAGALVLDRARRQVTLGGQPVELTVKEFDLLEHLMRHQGQVVSREALARDIWREFARTTPIDNVIDVHIARLRRKIDDGPVKMIHTIRGVGFMLTDGGR
jgi:DNA-binding response OmpR family regulator